MLWQASVLSELHGLAAVPDVVVKLYRCIGDMLGHEDCVNSGGRKWAMWPFSRPLVILFVTHSVSV